MGDEFAQETFSVIGRFFPTKESVQRHLHHNDVTRICPICAFVFTTAFPVWERYGGSSALRESLERHTAHMTDASMVTEATLGQALEDGAIVAAWDALVDDVDVLMRRYDEEDPGVPDWQLRARLAAGMCVLHGLGDAGEHDGVLSAEDGLAKPAALLLVAADQALRAEAGAGFMQENQRRAGLRDN